MNLFWQIHADIFYSYSSVASSFAVSMGVRYEIRCSPNKEEGKEPDQKKLQPQRVMKHKDLLSA